MSLMPEIRSRYSARAFDPRPIEADKLRDIFDAARWAASAMNEQPWRYLVTLRGQGRHSELAECLTGKNRIWAPQAPVLAVSMTARRHAHNGSENATARHDLGLANAQLMIQARAHGLHVHPMGGFDTARVRRHFQIAEELDLVAALAIGYPGNVDDLPNDLREREKALRVRKELSEIVFLDEMDNPYPFPEGA